MNFLSIYDEYISIVYGYLSIRLVDQYLVEDITQEVFIDIYKSIKQINKVNNLKSYILKIAHNKMVDKLRKEKNTNQLKDDMLSNQVIEIESNITTLELLKELAEDERIIIYNLYIVGLKVKEVAEIMNIPEGTVKSKCYYARKKLKKLLE